MVSKVGIGWDIGIKNLAYCIIEPINILNSEDTFKINGNYYKIHKWADISLVSQIENNLQNAGEVRHLNNALKCCCPKNDKLNAPECGNTASYCHETLSTTGEYRGYCKTHFKKSGIERMPDIQVKKCYMIDCSSRVHQVLKSHIYTGYCKKHVNEMIKTGSKTLDDFFNLNKAKTTAKIDINHLGIALFQELDKIKTDILTPDIILLENQPVLKNPTMKSMQMFLYSYYLIRNMETNAKNNYQKNKKQSIMMVEYLLTENPKWLEFFKKHNKQDDLADSLLMTLHYFEKGNLAKLKKNDSKNNTISTIPNPTTTT